MKKVMVAFVLGLLMTSAANAGENPKLLKEIQRKIKIDFSKLKLDNDKQNYVLVKFKVVDQEVEIINIEGSENDLESAMICELEEMFIKSSTDSEKVFKYKFTFENE